VRVPDAGVQRTLRFGFVGAGEIAVESAEAVRDAPHAELVGVFDVRRELADDLAERFGGTAASSLDDLLADDRVDAVYVCVPHFLHVETSVAAAEAGRVVFVEKPMGVRPEDARTISEACDRAGVACSVPFLVREAPAYRAARELVASGAIGAVTGFRITFRADKPASYWTGGWSGRATDGWRSRWATAGGGTLLMNTIHDLDALLWITGLDVERVHGAIATVSSPAEVEDVGLAILACSSGALGTIEALTAVPGGSPPESRWVNGIDGTHGQLALPTPWAQDGLAMFTRASGEWADVEPGRGGTARARTFEAFAVAVLDGREPPIPARDGLRASRIVHAVYESARTGAPVDVPSAGATS